MASSARLLIAWINTWPIATFHAHFQTPYPESLRIFYKLLLFKKHMNLVKILNVTEEIPFKKYPQRSSRIFFLSFYRVFCLLFSKVNSETEIHSRNRILNNIRNGTVNNHHAIGFLPNVLPTNGVIILLKRSLEIFTENKKHTIVQHSRLELQLY